MVISRYIDNKLLQAWLFGRSNHCENTLSAPNAVWTTNHVNYSSHLELKNKASALMQRLSKHWDRKTGGPRERIDLTELSPFLPEHRSRYRFAASYVDGKTVLDVACGAGWGGNMLLDAGASSVTGVDQSEAAIATAARNIRSGYTVKCADACALPLADSSIDIVVSFETLEHIKSSHQFLQELRRVLRDDGLLLLSTPNALHTKPIAGVPHNPYHVREYTADTLREAVGTYFSHIELRGQRVAPRFRPCPYWERPELCKASPVNRIRSLAWKLIARLPGGARDKVAKYVLGHPLFPGEADFVFEAMNPEAGHVLLALCKP